MNLASYYNHDHRHSNNKNRHMGILDKCVHNKCINPNPGTLKTPWKQALLLSSLIDNHNGPSIWDSVVGRWLRLDSLHIDGAILLDHLKRPRVMVAPAMMLVPAELLKRLEV